MFERVKLFYKTQNITRYQLNNKSIKVHNFTAIIQEQITFHENDIYI